jgi:hypothetical protein
MRKALLEMEVVGLTKALLEDKKLAKERQVRRVT